MQEPIAIAMPKLGMTMREGTVVEWRVLTGERIEKGAVLLVIESEKSEVDVDSPASGFLRHVYVDAGETVPCGTLLAALTAGADETFDVEAFRAKHAPVVATAGAAAASAAASATAPAGVAARALAPAVGEEPAGVPATPAARRLARERGIDLSRIAGSGPGGRITREDVEVFASRLAARVEVEPGVALDLAVEGEGTLALLLPGFGTDASAFAPIVPALTAHHRVAVLNPRGMGFSDAPESGSYTVDIAARDAAAVLAAQGKEGAPAHVVGASLGAAAAVELAIAHPELVRSLVLITPLAQTNGRLIAVLEAWCDAAATGDSSAVARTVVPWMFSERLLADETRRRRAARAFARMAAGLDARALARWLRGVQEWPGLDQAALARLSVPTLVIAGDDDALLPHAAGVAGMIPGATLRVIEDAGHAVTIEHPGDVAVALLEFFERVSST